MKFSRPYLLIFLPAILLNAAVLLNGCSQAVAPKATESSAYSLEKRLDKLVTIRLNTGIDALKPWEKALLTLLMDAADQMDTVFWKQLHGQYGRTILDQTRDPVARKWMAINYGPWDRYEFSSESQVPGFSARPPGVGFYPVGVDKIALEKAIINDAQLKSPYSLVLQDTDNRFKARFYSDAFGKEHQKAAEDLRKAAKLTQSKEQADYFNKLAQALLDNNYEPAERAWALLPRSEETAASPLSAVDFVAGPIERYDDYLLNQKTAHQAYILIRNTLWSSRLRHYEPFLADLQTALPLSGLSNQRPENDFQASLEAFDAVYLTGQANAGAKAIAFNLPNNIDIQRTIGTRSIQLVNLMRAKFNHMLRPITEVMLVPEQRGQVRFSAFFTNTLLHELSHGVGVKITQDGSTVQNSLKSKHLLFEESKADAVGLYMAHWLNQQGKLLDITLENALITGSASLFRTMRFGTESAHGQAALIRFNYFREQGALLRTQDGLYFVDLPVMINAITRLGRKILSIQFNGEPKEAQAFIDRYGKQSAELKADMQRIRNANIAEGLVLEQGWTVINDTIKK
ncbi:MAG: hypothetical protein HQL54_06935 [Magnetococcales bacterium]|nr:hypothetical protein [Magnetococcales bacterium]